MTPALAPPAAAAAPAPPKGPPTEVARVTVTAPVGDPPVVASSWPAPGASIPPGTTVVKITFSQPMSPDRFGFGPVPGARYPRCLDRPRLLADQRTFVLLCVTAGKAAWALRLNPAEGAPSAEGDAPAGGRGFTAAGGRRLAPTDLAFSTTDDAPVGPLEDAMKAAGLADDQGPVMDERAQAAVPAPAGATPFAPAPPPADTGG